MKQSSHIPYREVLPIEYHTLLSDIVEFGEVLLELEAVSHIVDVLFEDSFNQQRQSSEDHIVTSNVVVVIDSLS